MKNYYAKKLDEIDSDAIKKYYKNDESFVPEHGALPLDEISFLFETYNSEHPNIHHIRMIEDSDSIDASNAPLFPNNTVTTEFCQGVLGDCWLIAALRGLIEQKQGIQLLAYTMRDLTGLAAFTGQGNSMDGKVLIRVITENEHEITLPSYLIIDKRYFDTPHSVMSQQLVIKLAEQVMSHLRGNGRFNDLQSGFAFDVFNKWFGVKEIPQKKYFSRRYQRNLICQDIWKKDYKEPGVLRWLFSDSSVEEAFKLLQPLLEEIFPKINPGQQLSHQQFEQFKEKAVEKCAQLKNKKLKQAANTYLETILGKLTSKIEPYLINDQNAAELSPFQEETLSTIKKALNGSKLVFASTDKNVGHTSGLGFSAGEAISDGIVGKHAYAILGLEEINGIPYVAVANPWGAVDYKYEFLQKKFPVLSPAFEVQEEQGKTYFTRKGVGTSPVGYVPVKEFTAFFSNIQVIDSPEEIQQNVTGVVELSKSPHFPKSSRNFRLEQLRSHFISPVSNVNSLVLYYAWTGELNPSKSCTPSQRWNYQLEQHKARRDLLTENNVTISDELRAQLVKEYAPCLKKLIIDASDPKFRYELWKEYQCVLDNPTYKVTFSDIRFYISEALYQEGSDLSQAAKNKFKQTINTWTKQTYFKVQSFNKKNPDYAQSIKDIKFEFLELQNSETKKTILFERIIQKVIGFIRKMACQKKPVLGSQADQTSEPLIAPAYASLKNTQNTRPQKPSISSPLAIGPEIPRFAP